MALKYLVLALCLQFYVQLAEGQDYFMEFKEVLNKVNQSIINTKNKVNSMLFEAQMKVNDQVQIGEVNLTNYVDELRKKGKQCYDEYLPDMNKIINEYRNETRNCNESMTIALDAISKSFIDEMDNRTKEFYANTTCNNNDAVEKAMCEALAVTNMVSKIPYKQLEMNMILGATTREIRFEGIPRTTFCIRNTIDKAEEDMRVVKEMSDKCRQ